MKRGKCTYIADVTYRYITRDADGNEAVTIRDAVVWYPDRLHRFLVDKRSAEEHR